MKSSTTARLWLKVTTYSILPSGSKRGFAYTIVSPWGRRTARMHSRLADRASMLAALSEMPFSTRL